MTYDAADNSAKCYEVAIAAMRDKLASFRREIIGDCTLYLGDCREILPLLPAVDAVITDPPYVGLVGGFEHLHGGVAPHRVKTKGVGDIWGATHEWCALAEPLAKRAVISFCGYADIVSLRQAFMGEKAWLLTWFIRNAPAPRNSVVWFRSEHIWVVKRGVASWHRLSTVYDIPKLNAGCAGSPERERNPDGTAAHPTQKPLSLISELLLPEFETVLDPFMGSGTTGVACVKAGRKFTGIEVDPKHFDLACERIAAAYAQPDMFIAAPKPEQTCLLLPVVTGKSLEAAE
jgi:DNA modification methylase